MNNKKNAFSLILFSFALGYGAPVVAENYQFQQHMPFNNGVVANISQPPTISEFTVSKTEIMVGKTIIAHWNVLGKYDKLYINGGNINTIELNNSMGDLPIVIPIMGAKSNLTLWLTAEYTDSQGNNGQTIKQSIPIHVLIP